MRQVGFRPICRMGTERPQKLGTCPSGTASRSVLCARRSMKYMNINLPTGGAADYEKLEA